MMANSKDDESATSKVDFSRDEELQCCRDIYSSSLDPLPAELRNDAINLLHHLSKSNADSDGAKEKCTELILQVEKALAPESMVCDTITRLLSERLRKLYAMEDAVGLVRDRMERLKMEDFGSLQTLSRLYNLSGEYSKSSKEQQAALQLAKIMGDPLMISLAYAKLACCEWHLQNPEDARKKLKLCFDLLEDCEEAEIASGYPKTESARWLIDIYKTVGYIHRLFKDHAKCAEYYLKALAIVEKDERAITELLKLETQIASDFSRCREKSEAREYCDRAHERIKKLTENEAFMIHHTFTVIHALSRIAYTLQIIERNSRVMDLREQLYSIAEKYLSANHPEVARIAADNASLANVLNDIEKETFYVQKANAALEYNTSQTDSQCKFIKTHVRELSDAWFLLGKMYMNKNAFEDSKRCLTMAIAINTRVYGGNHPRLSRLHQSMGYLYKKFDKFSEAAESFRKCKKINEEFSSGDEVLLQKLDKEIRVVSKLEKTKFGF